VIYPRGNGKSTYNRLLAIKAIYNHLLTNDKCTLSVHSKGDVERFKESFILMGYAVKVIEQKHDSNFTKLEVTNFEPK